MVLFGVLRRCLTTVQSTTKPSQTAYTRTPVACRRWFNTSVNLSKSVEDLEAAKQKVTTLTEDPGNEAKLKLYGLFKQVSDGRLINMLKFNECCQRCEINNYRNFVRLSGLV